ncbi:Drug/Metabolite Transporter (DMT) Superfamily [Planoprotostelium fungivorum]|uniref:Drug/Metabolite Transporter (DMT) Superfamily n=1 Tax=Planoprotostelium fungivorum TaxID=1890364 RepID=A0A2P6NB45_9EUKA|nr:Drug/Metabolite Transporter (DMT) Superfamily [Planoprotostelium fungivorum]
MTERSSLVDSRSASQASFQSTDARGLWRQDTAERILSITTLFLFTFVLLEAGLAILQKKVAQPMEHYPSTLTIFQPCCTTILFGIGALAVKGQLSRKRRRQLEGFSKINGSLDPKNLGNDALIDLYSTADHFPKWRLAVLGFLFTVSNFCTFSGISGDLVPLPIIVILKQAAIPYTMLIAFLFLQKRFNLLHFLGVLLILAGIVISIEPEIVHVQSATWWRIGLILIGIAFLSTAAVFMEHSLKGYEQLEMFYMWFWINLFEVIFALPVVLLMILVQHIHPRDAPENVWQGFKCLLAGQPSQEGDNCGEVGYWWIGFVSCLILDKINQAYLLRHTSSTLMWISSTCAVPLAALAALIPFLQLKHSGFSWWEIGGLFAVVCGLILYRITPERQKQAAHYQSMIE